MDIRDKTEKKVFRYIEEHGMIAPYDRIVVGVSGGADSVCLLLLLLEYAVKVPLSLAVAHIDHCLRAEAKEDARYVETLCGQKGIPFFLTTVDVHGLALEEKCSQEDMGRRVRYQAFRQVAKKLGGALIAVAHNSNDNAETMLFHLFRGSGLKGLGGIAPMREADSGRVIRPILCLERREVEAYLRERNVSWRVDGTNSEDCYRRNRIRHHILPYAEAEIVTGAISHMCQTADMLREAESFLEQQTAQALKQCLESGEHTAVGLNGKDVAGGWPGEGMAGGRPGEDAADMSAAERRYVVNIEAFQKFHAVLRKRMLLTLLKNLSPTGKDISLVHVRDTMTLFMQEGNRCISLPYGIVAWRQYGKIIIERKEEIPRAEIGQNHACQGQHQPSQVQSQIRHQTTQVQRRPGQLQSQIRLRDKPPVLLPAAEEMTEFPFICDLGSMGKMEFSVFFIQKDQKVPKNRYTKWFDYDKIEESVMIRSRGTGDFFTLADGAGKIMHKSLKDYMITEKIPRQIRDEIPVIAAGKHILWLAGWRISEYFKVEENTKRVLQVKLL